MARFFKNAMSGVVAVAWTDQVLDYRCVKLLQENQAVSMFPAPLDTLESSSNWVEMVLIEKPPVSDETAFPLIMDALGGVWRADPVGGGWRSVTRRVFDLDQLDQNSGPLTVLGAL